MGGEMEQFDANQAVEITKETWDSKNATAQRIYFYTRKGLIKRCDDSELNGRFVRYAARDLAVMRVLDAARNDRGESEMLRAFSYALYFRQAPDGTAAIGAGVYWAARCFLGLEKGAPVLSAYRLAKNGETGWRAFMLDATRPAAMPDDCDLLAQVAVPLGRAFLPVLPHFTFPEIVARKAAMQ